MCDVLILLYRLSIITDITNQIMSYRLSVYLCEKTQRHFMHSYRFSNKRYNKNFKTSVEYEFLCDACTIDNGWSARKASWMCNRLHQDLTMCAWRGFPHKPSTSQTEPTRWECTTMFVLLEKEIGRNMIKCSLRSDKTQSIWSTDRSAEVSYDHAQCLRVWNIQRPIQKVGRVRTFMRCVYDRQWPVRKKGKLDVQ